MSGLHAFRVREPLSFCVFDLTTARHICARTHLHISLYDRFHFPDRSKAMRFSKTFAPLPVILSDE